MKASGKAFCLVLFFHESGMKMMFHHINFTNLILTLNRGMVKKGMVMMPLEMRWKA